MAKKRVEVAPNGGGGSKESYPVRARLAFRGRSYNLLKPVNYLNLFSAAGDIVRDVTNTREMQPPIHLRYQRNIITNNSDFDSIMAKVEENSLVSFDITIDRGNPKARHFPALLDEDTPSIVMTITDDDEIETLRGMDTETLPTLGGSNRSIRDPFNEPIHLEAPFAEAGRDSVSESFSNSSQQEKIRGANVNLKHPGAPESVDLRNLVSSKSSNDSTSQATSTVTSVLSDPSVARALAAMLQSPAFRPVVHDAAEALTNVLIKHSTIVITEFATALQASPSLGSLLTDGAMRNLLSVIAASAATSQQAVQQAVPQRSDDLATKNLDIGGSVSSDARSSGSTPRYEYTMGNRDHSPERNHVGYHQVPLVTQAIAVSRRSADSIDSVRESSDRGRVAPGAVPSISRRYSRPQSSVVGDGEFSMREPSVHNDGVNEDHGLHMLETRRSVGSSTAGSLNSMQPPRHKRLQTKIIARYSPKEVVVPSNEDVKVTWRIQNSGRTDWPSGTVLVRRSGNFYMNPAPILHGPIRPNDVATITFTVRVDSKSVERGNLQLYDSSENEFYGDEMPITFISEEHLPRTPIQKAASAPRLREMPSDELGYSTNSEFEHNIRPSDHFSSIRSFPRDADEFYGMSSVPAQRSQAQANSRIDYPSYPQTSNLGRNFNTVELNLRDPQTRAVVEQLASEYKVDGDVVLDILREEGTLDIERCRVKLGMIMGMRG